MKVFRPHCKHLRKSREPAGRLALITPPDVMRWRIGKSFLIGVASFSFGCILTLFLCSSNDSAVDIASSEPNQGIENAEDETPQQIPAEELTADEVSDEEINVELPTTTNAPKPTLPPYPPVSNGKPLVLTPSSCNEGVFLVIIVVSSSRNFEARKAVRSSWGKSISEVKRFSSNSTHDSFQVFFVVGGDEVNDERVEKEAKQYGDILRGNFMDTYVQNDLHTVKTLLGLKWATSICNPQYILKVNSDSFVNVHETIKWLYSLGDSSEPEYKHKEGLYTGYCHTGGVRPVRNPQSAYFISEDQWSEDLLPSYVSGVGIVLSRDVGERMANYAREMKLIHIDDVFLGVMAQNLGIGWIDEGSRFDIAYTTMLTECEDLHFCVLGGVLAKDMFYLSQNVEHLRELCADQEPERDLPLNLMYA
ncbi:hypothetical protein ACROYT_G001641 [Oculina patagonica]